MDLMNVGYEDVDWLHLSRYRAKWWAPVNTINYVTKFIQYVSVDKYLFRMWLPCHTTAQFRFSDSTFICMAP